MTRPSKLFVGKMYIAVNTIGDAKVESWPHDGRTPTMDAVPLLTNVTIECGTPVMFLKRETKSFRNHNWGWSNPEPVQRQKFFMFLAKDKVVLLKKASLRNFQKLTKKIIKQPKC